MTIELTEIINCRIRGPMCFLKKDPVLLDQDIKEEQIVPCRDATWRINNQNAGIFVIEPRSIHPEAVCKNFGCANNQWLDDMRH